ncbi:hypothetical protein BHM03_00043621 [Ensete ventricosum]|nr:hypothetical protein BHM03_00043621 [Ensete ventricosum]
MVESETTTLWSSLLGVALVWEEAANTMEHDPSRPYHRSRSATSHLLGEPEAPGSGSSRPARSGGASSASLREEAEAEPESLRHACSQISILPQDVSPCFVFCMFRLPWVRGLVTAASAIAAAVNPRRK